MLSATLLHFNQPGVVLSGAGQPYPHPYPYPYPYPPPGASVTHAGLMFGSIFVGSMVIGLAGGLCASFAFGQLELHRRPPHEHEAAVPTEAYLQPEPGPEPQPQPQPQP